MQYIHGMHRMTKHAASNTNRTSTAPSSPTRISGCCCCCTFLISSCSCFTLLHHAPPPPHTHTHAHTRAIGIDAQHPVPHTPPANTPPPQSPNPSIHHAQKRSMLQPIHNTMMMQIAWLTSTVPSSPTSISGCWSTSLISSCSCCTPPTPLCPLHEPCTKQRSCTKCVPLHPPHPTPPTTPPPHRHPHPSHLYCSLVSHQDLRLLGDVFDQLLQLLHLVASCPPPPTHTHARTHTRYRY